MEKHFGEILRELRDKRGLTLNQYAIYAGVSPGLVSKIENGKRGTPKPETIEKLAKGLKMEYTDLMRLAGYMNGEPSEKNTEPNNNEEGIEDIYRQAEEHFGVNLRDDPDVQDAVREYIFSLAKMKSK